MTLHKQRVVLKSPFGKLTYHFRSIPNGERGTLLRQDPSGSYLIEFDSVSGEVKVPPDWLEWVSELEPEKN